VTILGTAHMCAASSSDQAMNRTHPTVQILQVCMCCSLLVLHINK
jgi:hypothetical protein